MPTLSKMQDAYGQAMWDHYRGAGGYEIVEREDGFVQTSMGPRVYLAPFRAWPAHQKAAIRLARGRVLDVGCGAGRAALWLQQKGFEVTGIDTSPLAIRVCKDRGLADARLLSITRVSPKLGVFDTILMFGNNFGLFGGLRRGRWLLRRLYQMTSPTARIIAESRDPYQTGLACHRAYQAFNRRRGRMSGQLRIRIRYQTRATPWFDYLLVSQDEMRQLLDGTGWHVSHFLDGQTSLYVAVIEKGAAAR